MTSAPDASTSPTPTEHKPKQKSLLGWILMLVILGAGALFGIHSYTQSLTREVTDNAQVVGNITPVSSKVRGQITQVRVRDNDLVHKGDLLFTLDDVDYQTKVTQAQAAFNAAKNRLAQAKIQAVLTERTTSALVGEKTSSIDVSHQQVTSAAQSVAVAQAESIRSNAGIAEAKAGISAAEASLSRAKAELSKAQAEAKRLTDDRIRYQTLFQKREVSEQQFEAATTASSLAIAQVEAARQVVASAQAGILSAQAGLANAVALQKVASENIARAAAGHQEAEARTREAQERLVSAQAGTLQATVAKVSLDGFEADIKQAGAQLEQAKLALSYTKIYAPSNGRVARKNLNPGQFVEAGAPVLALVDESDLWVVANFKETQMERMEVGQKVKVNVDTYPKVPLEGRIDSIQPGTGAVFSLLPPENASGSFIKVVQRIPVKIVFSKEEKRRLTLRPGMSVEATVWLK